MEPDWLLGTIVNSRGPLSYTVKLSDGCHIKRHVGVMATDNEAVHAVPANYHSLLRSFPLHVLLFNYPLFSTCTCGSCIKFKLPYKRNIWQMKVKTELAKY